RCAGRRNVALSDTEPLLAAVVITRNEERWIETCLRSVIAAGAPFEGGGGGLVDSCSSGGTGRGARRVPGRGGELRAGRAVSRALGRLVGQHVTRSRYVLFVDGDTEIEAAWVKAAVDYLDTSPRVAGIGGKLPEIYYDGGHVVGATPDVFEAGDAPAEVDELGGNAIYRRAVLDTIGSFNPFVVSYEESELTERLRHAGHAVVRLPVVLGTHHTGPRGSLKGLSRRYRDNLIKGYGQVLRLALRQGTFRRHARRMKRYLQFQAAIALALLALGAGAVLGDWRLPALCAAGAAAGIVL